MKPNKLFPKQHIQPYGRNTYDILKTTFKLQKCETMRKELEN